VASWPGSLHPGHPRRAHTRSRGRVRPGLLRHHVGGIPRGPVIVLARPVKKVRSPRPFLVLDVGGLGTPKRACQIRRGRECRVSAVDPAGQPRRYLLHQPRIAVGIVDGTERPVAVAFGVRTWLPRLGRERRAVPDRVGIDARPASSSRAATTSETISPPSAEPGAEHPILRRFQVTDVILPAADVAPRPF
jgi:hypothetical protein